MRNCDAFFAAMGRLTLSFNDVRLQTGYSDTDYHDADISSYFSRNIKLKVPFVSAAMDTVTKSEMAIELAKLGGIGVIHKQLTIEEQAYEVRRVKKHLNGLISGPICVQGDQTVESVLRMCDDKRFDFRSFPVLDEQLHLIGVLTGTDIDFCERKSVLVRDAMTRNVVACDEQTDADKAFELMREQRFKLLPLINSGGEVTGLYVLSDLLRLRNPSGLHNTDRNGQLVVAAAIGTGTDALERAEALVAKRVDAIVIDAAHGDSRFVFETFQAVRANHPDVDIIVGNITQPKSAIRLAELGVDGIKIGQGGGSICTTRVVTGIGRPQVTAIHSCVKAVRDLVVDSQIPVNGDGGIEETGDACLALAAGADSIMAGYMFAGTDESPGDVVVRGNRQYKRYRGMGSPSAMEESANSRERYGEMQTSKSKILAEGVEGYVPYIGSLENLVLRLSEALRRSMGYVGAQNLAEFHEKADFDRVTSEGMRESRPHGIVQSDS